MKIINYLKEIFNLSSKRKKYFQLENDKIILINTENIFILYDTIQKTPIGYISWFLSDGDVYSIHDVYSINGCGPLLYEIVMTYVYPKGITLSTENGTSEKALHVWEKFYKRKDITKEKILRSKKSHKEIELINACDDDCKECLKRVNKILFYHRIKYTYSFDIQNLNLLLVNGVDYMYKNPELNISEIIELLEKHMNTISYF